MDRLDYYDILPAGMEHYISLYGWHFSKAMCEWAVSGMKDRNKKKVQMRSKKEVDELLNGYGVVIDNDKGYDSVFVFHMGLSDYFRSSMNDETNVAKYVKDVLDDVDGYDGIAFTRFLADCNAKGVPIIWEDMI